MFAMKPRRANDFKSLVKLLGYYSGTLKIPNVN